MKPNVYMLIQQCVEDGILYGWVRAHKHTDTPTDEAVRDEIYEAVMARIAEWFVFDDQNGAP